MTTSYLQLTNTFGNRVLIPMDLSPMFEEMGKTSPIPTGRTLVSMVHGGIVIEVTVEQGVSEITRMIGTIYQDEREEQIKS